MKKFLLFAVAALVAMVACESKTPDTPEVSGKMTVTSAKKLDFGYVGGAGEITFTIEGGKPGDVPTAVSSQPWVNSINVSDKVTFSVDANDVEESRMAMITLSYNEDEVQVTIVQAAAVKADVEHVAKTLNGEYYGTTYSPGHNYFIVLSENGTTGFSDMYVDIYYRLDLYSDVALTGGTITIPHGTYTFDPFSMGQAGTFGNQYSVRLQPMSDGNLTEEHFVDGTVTVTENHIDALLTLENGMVHHVTYDGSLELGWVEIPEPDYYSYLTEDYSFDHDLGVMRMTYYGDYYNTGGTNWTISAMECPEPINGDYFMFDIVTANTGTDFEDICGEYTCVATEDEAANGVFFAGGMDNRQMTFSWYRVVEDNYIVQTSGAPMVGGKIKIEKDGSNYVLTVDCVDDLGYKVQGRFSCSVLEFYDGLAQ
ncbi:MAG: BACON domain-containing protein [Alistipes sp.]|nr:BACON domain-containing protein [Alistipes sp.]